MSGLTLHLDVERWRRHLRSEAAATPGLVPVVKGNGYGFGRTALAQLATTLSPVIAVGTVHELGGVPAGVRPLVLTPPAPDGGSSGSLTTAERLGWSLAGEDRRAEKKAEETARD